MIRGVTGCKCWNVALVRIWGCEEERVRDERNGIDEGGSDHIFQFFNSVEHYRDWLCNCFIY